MARSIRVAGLVHRCPDHPMFPSGDTTCPCKWKGNVRLQIMVGMPGTTCLRQSIGGTNRKRGCPMKRAMPAAVLMAMATVYSGAASAAGGDAAKGKTVFTRCLICHTVEPAVHRPLSKPNLFSRPSTSRASRSMIATAVFCSSKLAMPSPSASTRSNN